MPESKFKNRLVEQAGIKAGHRILDLGCGTGTLTILIKKTHPDTEVVGLDGDPKILNIARAKAAKAGVELTFNNAMAFELPYPDASFDRVVSSLVFHHLTRENKVRALEEVFRVLKPYGELHVADWGKPQNLLMRVASLPLRMFDGLETTHDNVKGLLPEMFRKAGFEEVQEATRFMTLFGTLSLYKARKPH
jgi:ubiquinone/menaquinone biosynthesis C-methylase UbiE